MHSSNFVQECSPPCLQTRPTHKLYKRTVPSQLERCHSCRARRPPCPLSTPLYPLDTPHKRWSPWCWSSDPWGTCYNLAIRDPRQTAPTTNTISSSGIQWKLGSKREILYLADVALNTGSGAYIGADRGLAAGYSAWAAQGTLRGTERIRHRTLRTLQAVMLAERTRIST